MNDDIISFFELHILFPKIVASKNLGNVRHSNVILPWQFAQLNGGFLIECLSVSSFLFQQRIRGSSGLSIPDKLFRRYHQISCSAVFHLQHNRHKRGWSACPELFSKPMVMYFFGLFFLFCAKAVTRGGRGTLSSGGSRGVISYYKTSSVNICIYKDQNHGSSVFT